MMVSVLAFASAALLFLAMISNYKGYDRLALVLLVLVILLTGYGMHAYQTMNDTTSHVHIIGGN